MVDKEKEGQTSADVLLIKEDTIIAVGADDSLNVSAQQLLYCSKDRLHINWT